MSIFKKAPDAVLTYGWDWSAWLVTDTIVSSTWLIPSDLVEEGSTFSTTITSVLISGGVLGEEYTITNHIVTAAGEEDERSHKLKVVER
jgi:hypothetical protein